MSKLIAESLDDYIKDKEQLNESLAVGGKLFRELFLKAAHALVKAGRTEDMMKLVKWAKKLKGLGYPKLAQLKQELGDDLFKKFDKGLLTFMQKQIPSFGASPSGATSGGKGGDIGKDDNERLAVVAKAAGMSTEELKDLITRK